MVKFVNANSRISKQNLSSLFSLNHRPTRSSERVVAMKMCCPFKIFGPGKLRKKVLESPGKVLEFFCPRGVRTLAIVIFNFILFRPLTGRLRVAPKMTLSFHLCYNTGTLSPFPLRCSRKLKLSVFGKKLLCSLVTGAGDQVCKPRVLNFLKYTI